MSLLKRAPPQPVRSLDEMFAIAHAMEHEAATRYSQLAQQAQTEAPQVADLFRRLAADERGHEESVAGWSRQRSGKAPDPARIKWELPETFDAETAEQLARSRLSSAYRILSLAVRNEERAFAFWSYVAAEAETADIREAAERMAHEELGHVAMLRRARRQAYHAERKDHIEPRPQSARLAEAAVLERRLADRLAAQAERLTDAAREQSHAWAAQSRAMADEVAPLAGQQDAAVEDYDIAAAAERLVEDYLDIAEVSRDEALTARAQSLAAAAILRLAWIRGLALGQRSSDG